MFPPVKLKNLEIKSPLVLSPMSGVTSSPLRRLLKRLNGENLGLVVTEFVSVEAIVRNIPRTKEMMRFRDEERPLGIQIFGFDVGRMTEGAKIVEDAGADLVEINCGCPAPKVVRKGGGCELMRKPQHLRGLVASIRAAVKIPLTVKMRSGYEQHDRNALEIAGICEGEGADAVIVHGRTKKQGYKGSADWDFVRDVAANLSIPVFGSGDIINVDSARLRSFGESGSQPCGPGKGISGLYIGRGAISNPLVFSEIATGKPRNIRENEGLVLGILEEYARLLAEDFPDKLSVGRMKQLATGLCRGLQWRKSFLLCKTFADEIDFIARKKEEVSKEPALAEGLGERKGPLNA